MKTDITLVHGRKGDEMTNGHDRKMSENFNKLAQAS